ncbi:MAG: hypothetical protein ACI4S3_10285 [Candidatus Gastranaerophilaceae bacterium]
MFSKSFMKFLINYDDNNKEQTQEEYNIEEIEFKSVKVNKAAQVVVASIKESF